MLHRGAWDGMLPSALGSNGLGGDEMVNTQLVLVRQFFDEARRAPAAETPFLRMKRTLNLDLCVEMALGAAVVDHGTPEDSAKMARRDLSWPDLWKAADAAARAKLNKGLPEGRQLRTLHEMRNLAQHRGSIPSAEDIAGWVEPTRTLLDFVCRDFYQREFENLREWDALECEPIRHWLMDCAEAIDLEAPYAAVVACKIAYGRIVETVRNTVAGPMPTAAMDRRVTVKDPELAKVVNAIGSSFKEFQSGLQEVLLVLEAEIMAVGIGLSVADHIRFLRCGRGVQVMDVGRSGFRSWATGGDPEQHREDAEFMVNYLAKATVMLESALPGVFDGLQLGPRPSETPLWELVERPEPSA